MTEVVAPPKKNLEHPDAVEASLDQNTRVRIDISSVAGVGNVFHRKREAATDWEPGDEMEQFKTYAFVMDWRDNPLKSKAQGWWSLRWRPQIAHVAGLPAHHPSVGFGRASIKRM
jgi:phage terminase large subunit